MLHVADLRRSKNNFFEKFGKIPKKILMSKFFLNGFCNFSVALLCRTTANIYLWNKFHLSSKKSNQKQPSIYVLRKRCSENMQQIYRRTPKLTCGFNKVALQRFWNCTSWWLLFYKFTAYFQNTFSYEHLWRAASEGYFGLCQISMMGLFSKSN